MYKKDFIDTNDFTKQELLDIIDLSLAIQPVSYTHLTLPTKA